METNRIASNNISNLKPNEIFVFGSNESGIHGAGAAYQALKWGAIRGQGFGLQGQTFAIPTKDYNIETLPLMEIALYVSDFVDFATNHPELKFLVTEIGCGLAGYTVDDIAPLFIDAYKLNNVYLPERFIVKIKKI